MQKPLRWLVQRKHILSTQNNISGFWTFNCLWLIVQPYFKCAKTLILLKQIYKYALKQAPIDNRALYSYCLHLYLQNDVLLCFISWLLFCKIICAHLLARLMSNSWTCGTNQTHLGCSSPTQKSGKVSGTAECRAERQLERKDSGSFSSPALNSV